MGAGQPLVLPTKLNVPAARPTTVKRPRLESELERVLATPAGAALVCAPAGWGKSTLVAGALEPNARRAAWLQLDADDNDQHRFAAHLDAALGLDGPGGAGSRDLRSTVDDVIRTVDETDEGVVLVLDDYHVISDGAIHGRVLRRALRRGLHNHRRRTYHP